MKDAAGCEAGLRGFARRAAVNHDSSAPSGTSLRKSPAIAKNAMAVLNMSDDWRVTNGLKPGGVFVAVCIVRKRAGELSGISVTCINPLRIISLNVDGFSVRKYRGLGVNNGVSGLMQMPQILNYSVTWWRAAEHFRNLATPFSGHLLFLYFLESRRS